MTSITCPECGGTLELEQPILSSQTTDFYKCRDCGRMFYESGSAHLGSKTIVYLVQLTQPSSKEGTTAWKPWRT